MDGFLDERNQAFLTLDCGHDKLTSTVLVATLELMA